MINKRIAAFTIMEVTITMLISALVIGITYSIFAIVSRSYQAFHRKNEEIANVLRLDGVLRKDFDRGELILKDSTGIGIVKPSGLIHYAFYPDYVLRNGIKTDTFKVKTDSVSTFFENTPINDVSPDKEQNRLDRVDIPVFLQNEKFTYHYSKIYSSENLFIRKPDAIH
jgi:hypothetical protein